MTYKRKRTKSRKFTRTKSRKPLRTKSRKPSRTKTKTKTKTLTIQMNRRIRNKTAKTTKTTKPNKTTKTNKTKKKVKPRKIINNNTRKRRKRKQYGGAESNNTTPLLNSQNSNTKTAAELRQGNRENTTNIYNYKTNQQKSMEEREKSKLQTLDTQIAVDKRKKTLAEMRKERQNERKQNQKAAQETEILNEKTGELERNQKEKEYIEKIDKYVKKKPYEYIKKFINDDFLSKAVNINIGYYLLGLKDSFLSKLSKKLTMKMPIIKRIRKTIFLEGTDGISTVAGNYSKLAGNKLFVIVLDENPDRKILLGKESLKKMNVIYLGDSIKEVNPRMTATEDDPGIYIYIALKKKDPKLIGVIKIKTLTSSQRLQKELRRDSERRFSGGPVSQYPQQQMMVPQMQSQQYQMPNQQQSYVPAAEREKQIIDSGTFHQLR